MAEHAAHFWSGPQKPEQHWCGLVGSHAVEAPVLMQMHLPLLRLRLPEQQWLAFLAFLPAGWQQR